MKRRCVGFHHAVFSYFFFFQAEDGIRDSSVTGVQTCALPIFRAAFRRQHIGARNSARTTILTARIVETGMPDIVRDNKAQHRFEMNAGDDTRSEERRVGKEGRSRWSPYH